MSRSRILAATLTATAAVVVATVVAPLGSSGGTAEAAGPTVVPAGFLALRTANGGNGSVTWLAPGGTSVLGTQTLAGASSCALANPAAATNLLAFAGLVKSGTAQQAAKPPSYRSGSLGVAEKPSGTSCFRVDTGETLVLETRTRNNVGPVVASAAYLDVELKQDSAILATLVRPDGTKAYAALLSGKSIASRPSLPAGVEPFLCSGTSSGADSGPDSGASDNCRWPISSPSWLGAPDDGIAFGTIELRSLVGSFSLEGGADGTPDLTPAPPTVGAAPRASVLELAQQVDGTLDCSDTVSSSDGAVTVRRLDNATGTCTPVPYTLSNDSTSATFRKPLDDQPTAQFAIQADWTVAAGSPAGGTAAPTYSPRTYTVLPATRISYEATPTSPDVFLGWCPDPQWAVVDGERVLTGLAATPTIDQDGTLAGVQYACVASSTSVVEGSQVLTTQWIYLYGDARLRY